MSKFTLDTKLMLWFKLVFSYLKIKYNADFIPLKERFYILDCV